MNHNKYSSVMIAQLMPVPWVGGFDYLFYLLAASGYDRCEHGIEHWGFENGRDFLTG
jgi:hypothetical protein